MIISLHVEPDAVAYVFHNSFSFEWFTGARRPEAAQPEADERLARTIFRDRHADISMLVAVGGTVEIEALDPDTDQLRWYSVTAADFQRAYAQLIMGEPARATLAREQIADLIEGSADANTCDSWLQFAVFRKQVYG